MSVRKVAEKTRQPRPVGRPTHKTSTGATRAGADAAAAAEWSVASAKAKFSEVVANAETSPQTIKRNGKIVAVVVGIDEWTRKTARKGSLAEFFLNSPLRGSGINLERSEIEPRDVKL